MMGSMDLQSVSVLIVERQPLMRMALCNAISAETDLQVAEADVDNSQTLVIPGSEDVLLVPECLDLILLSLGNPGQRELNALKILHHSRPDVPILVLTSNEVEGQEQSALEAGAQAVVTKSSSRVEIIQALREMRSKNSIHFHKSMDQEVNENTSPSK